MKIRKEISGLHCFDRKSGIHILLDEIKFNKNQIQNSPRIVSIALTNICDLKCHFCYAAKNRLTLEYDFLQNLSIELDKLGVLELTFGGGEPTLYPHFVELCKWIWENTDLGISFTTHGHRLTSEVIDEIINYTSMIRFSIDGIEPRYSEIRGKKLSDLLNIINYTKNKIPFGINCVVSKNNIQELINVIDLAIKIGAENILIIPEHLNGKFQLTTDDWRMLNEVIDKYDSQIELLVTYEAANFIKATTLNISYTNEFLFSHISADKKLKINSYDKEGLEITNLGSLESYFNQIHTL
jgi:MoaA/NifB/PqqE/SkfB family radical SAM enzyme